MELRRFKSLMLAGLFAVLLCIGELSFAQNLTVSGIPPYSSLDLTSDFSAAIASVTETWITGTGGGHNYTLSVKSLYGGLRHPTIASSKVTYSLTYLGNGGQTVTVTAVDQPIGSRSIANGTVAGSATANATIAYTGTSASSLYQGVYTDTLTFTLKKTGAGGAVTVSRDLVLTAIAIGSSLSISITPAAVATSLPLSTSQTNLDVGTAYEGSNSATGYRVKVRSANGGYLKVSTAGGSPSASEKVDYSLTYGGLPATLSPANTDSIVKFVNAGLYSGVANTLSMSYTAPATGTVVSGFYSDTLTFTIEAQ